jgi:hypothetical protein
MYSKFREDLALSSRKELLKTRLGLVKKMENSKIHKLSKQRENVNKLQQTIKNFRKQIEKNDKKLKEIK